MVARVSGVCSFLYYLSGESGLHWTRAWMARVSQRAFPAQVLGRYKSRHALAPFFCADGKGHGSRAKPGIPASLALSAGTAGRQDRAVQTGLAVASECARAAWLCLGPEGPLGAYWPSPKDCSCVNSGWGLGGHICSWEHCQPDLHAPRSCPWGSQGHREGVPEPRGDIPGLCESGTLSSSPGRGCLCLHFFLLHLVSATSQLDYQLDPKGGSGQGSRTWEIGGLRTPRWM